MNNFFRKFLKEFKNDTKCRGWVRFFFFKQYWGLRATNV